MCLAKVSSGKRKISDTDKQHNVFINVDSIELYCEGRCCDLAQLKQNYFFVQFSFISVEITYNGRKKKGYDCVLFIISYNNRHAFSVCTFHFDSDNAKYYSLNIFV